MIGSKWVYKIKRGPDNEPIRAKSRLVAFGNQQKEDTYDNTAAFVVHYPSLRVLFAVAVQEGLHLFQFDCANAYVQGNVDHLIFMRGPPGFERKSERGEPLVLKLKRSLYGLKQAGYIWQTTLVQHLEHLGFESLASEACMFVRKWESGGCEHKIIIALYVDDIMGASTHPEDQDLFLSELRQRFTVSPRLRCA